MHVFWFVLLSASQSLLAKGFRHVACSPVRVGCRRPRVFFHASFFPPHLQNLKKMAPAELIELGGTLFNHPCYPGDCEQQQNPEPPQGYSLVLARHTVSLPPYFQILMNMGVRGIDRMEGCAN